MAKNETRKICPRCSGSFVSITSGGVRTTKDGIHCVECCVEIMMEAFTAKRVRFCREVESEDGVQPG